MKRYLILILLLVSSIALGQFYVPGSGGGGTGWNWHDSSSHGPDSVLFADSSNHADVADTSLQATIPYSDSTDAITDGAVDMADIDQAGATTGQVIKWSGSAWEPAADATSTGAGLIVEEDGAGDTSVDSLNFTTGLDMSVTGERATLSVDINELSLLTDSEIQALVEDSLDEYMSSALLGNFIDTITTDTIPNADHATSADSSGKALQDADGNVITSTYLTSETDPTVDTESEAETEWGVSIYTSGDGAFIDSGHVKTNAISFPSDIAQFTEAELESALSNVTNLYTNNDGALNDDDVTLGDVQSACTNDFHNIGGTDDDSPDDDSEVPDAITVNPINATTEAAIEDSIELQDLQGAVTDGQVPDDITITESDDVDTTGTKISAALGDRAASTGQTWTGVHDFGGATSLEIPNGTNPTVDADGEIAYETDDECLRVYDGSANRAIPTKYHFAKTLLNPEAVADTTTHIFLWDVDSSWAEHGIKILNCGIKTIESSSYSLTFQEWTNADSSSGTETTIETVATSSSYEAKDDGVNDSDIAAGSIIVAEIPATDVKQVMMWMTYYIKTGD